MNFDVSSEKLLFYSGLIQLSNRNHSCMFSFACTFRILAIYRWVYNDDNWEYLSSIMPHFPKIVFYTISKNVKKMAHGHGMGRHTRDEVTHILQGDLTALSDFLGE